MWKIFLMIWVYRLWTHQRKFTFYETILLQRLHIQFFWKLINNYFYALGIFHSSFSGCISLKSEWQQDLSDLQDFSKYPSLFFLCCSVKSILPVISRSPNLCWKAWKFIPRGPTANRIPAFLFSMVFQLSGEICGLALSLAFFYFHGKIYLFTSSSLFVNW